MPRFAQPVKDVVTLVLTILVGICAGIYVDERSKPSERVLPLLFLIGFSLTQVLVTLVPSKDMEDLRSIASRRSRRSDSSMSSPGRLRKR